MKLKDRYYQINDRELATILAALTTFQRDYVNCGALDNLCMLDSFPAFEDIRPLTSTQITDLCNGLEDGKREVDPMDWR